MDTKKIKEVKKSKKRSISTKKAQAISMDLIVVISLILFSALFVIFTKINSQEDENFEKLVEKGADTSQTLFNSLKSDGVIVDNNAINAERMVQLSEEELRESLRLTDDFAIAFEKEGDLVGISSSQNITCLGTGKIAINGFSCGVKE